MSQTVLLIGATGMLGSKITHHLLDMPDTRVRLLLRAENKAEKKDLVKSFLNRGAELVEGALGDRESVDRATNDVDVIVSAVQGGPEVIIDGQVALAEIGKRNGVRRMLPSDFALDLFKATPGEHMMFDIRSQADAKIAATGIEHVHILQGAFMDMFRPGAGVIGKDGVVNFWGEGKQPIEVTSVDDTARMTARVAVDRSISSGKFSFAGDRVSILQATEIMEKETGQRYERRSLGSEADLRKAMAEAKKDRANPFKAVMLAYSLYMLNGQTALTDLQNDRYPDVKLQTFGQFVEHEVLQTS